VKLGLSSYTYTWAIGVPRHPPERPLDGMGLLDKAAALNVTVVQIADNLPLDRVDPAELDRLAARAGTLGIAIEVGTRGIAPDHLRAYLRLAQRLASPILRVVIDTPSHRPSADEIVDTLRSFVPDLHEAGVTLAIENHDRFPAATFVRIVERIDSDHVGVCLDTANSFGALEGPAVVVETLAPWTVNLHVKDFDVVRVPHQMGFAIEGRPAGQGRLDVPWLLARLRAASRAAGHDPNAILELWTPPEETLAGTIAKEDAWAASSVAYLRPLVEASPSSMGAECC
jgi:sugar phosphate isomerase/epimerase